MDSDRIAHNLAAVESYFHSEALNEVETPLETFTDDIVWEAPAPNGLNRSFAPDLEFAEEGVVMPSPARGLIWGACAASGVLLAGSLLPVWTEWIFTPWEGVGSPATLWQALRQLPANARAVGSLSTLWDLHLTNLIRGAILLAVAMAAGAGVYGMMSKRGTREP